MTKANKDASMGVDILALDTIAASDEGAEIELMHPTTEKPLGLFVSVLGKHSAVFRDHIREQVNLRLRTEAQLERRGKRPPVPTAEEVETKAIELLVLCTTGWRSQERDASGKLIEGTEKPTWLMGGEELPFTVANAIRVYTNILWIREQVDSGIGDLENFMKA